MPKFKSMPPSEVIIGRGRYNAIKRKPFEEAIRDSEAGRIILDPQDDPDFVKRLLRAASKTTGIRVRSSWEDNKKGVLLWKRTGIRNN